MTAAFYEEALFDSAIDFDHMEVAPEERTKATVDLAPFWRSAAAAFGVTAVIVFSSAGFSNPATVDLRVVTAEQRPFPTIPPPVAHQRMAERVRNLFKVVPLSASERVADPDYDL